jgi:hypothetical protein
MEIEKAVTKYEATAEQTEAAMKEPQKQAARERMAFARSHKKKPRTITRRDAVSATKVKVDTPSAAIKVDKVDIHWFGEYDMNPKTGRPASDFPSEYSDHAVSEMEKEVRSMQKQIDDDVYHGKDLRAFKEKHAVAKRRLEQIQEHKHDVERQLSNPVIRDKVASARKELGEAISESMFTYSSMNRMTDDPHIEAARMEGACIEVKDPVVADYCKQAGYAIVHGKISRTRASIIHKIMGKGLGAESLDIEELRRPDQDTRGRRIFPVRG